jgi:hypothetical protein
MQEDYTRSDARPPRLVIRPEKERPRSRFPAKLGPSQIKEIHQCPKKSSMTAVAFLVLRFARGPE